MAKPDLSHILAMAKARLGNKPAPINPAIAHTVLPVATVTPPRPMAELLAEAAMVPETEFEREWRRAQELGSAKASLRGPNLRLPYIFRGKVEVYKISELAPDSPIPAGYNAAKARQAVEAKAREDESYKGTAQERIALSHIRAKQARLQKLTHAEKRLLSKFNMAVFVARAGLNKRNPTED